MKLRNVHVIGAVVLIMLYVLIAINFRHILTQIFFKIDKSDTITGRKIEQNTGNNIQTGIVDFSNANNGLKNSLAERYADWRNSRIKSVATVLTPAEEENSKQCIMNAVTDLDTNGSIFWEGKNRDIRTSHHSYLKRKGSILLEVGGNVGDDAAEYVRLYNPKFLILEPLEEYAEMLRKRFKTNPRVTVVNLGLGLKNEVVRVKIEGEAGDATSEFSHSVGNVPLYITNTTQFLSDVGLGLFDIDLFTINCEGCEYEVLEAILSTNIVYHLRNIQFATHSRLKGLKDPVERYCRIQQLLLRTHRITYQYRLTWENWRRHGFS